MLGCDKMQRRYDIDWLRNIGVLLLIPFHSCLMFSLNQNDVVYMKAECNNQVLIKIANIIGFFHMPLLFMLAGMAIYLSLQKRDKKTFIKQRVVKLGIPTVVGVLIVNQLMTYIYLKSQGASISLVEHYLGMFSKPLEDFTGRNGSFTFAHLWFIFFLLCFSIIGLPLFAYLSSEKSQKIREKLADFFEKPLALSLLVIPYMLLYVTDILGWMNPIPYFFVVVIGCLIATDDRYRKALNRDKWIYFIVSIVEIGLSLTNVLQMDEDSAMGLVRDMIRLSARVIPVFALLGIFNCYFNKTSGGLRYLNKSSYTVYVVHMLINTAVAALIIPMKLPSGIRWLMIVFISYLLSFAAYEGLKRVPMIGYTFGVSYKAKSGRQDKQAA